METMDYYLNKIKKIFIKKIEEPKRINFNKEDLIKLDEIQNKILKVYDGSQSVGYKSDKGIYLLCLELLESLITSTIDDASKKISQKVINTKLEYIGFILGMLEKYFSNTFKDKL